MVLSKRDKAAAKELEKHVNFIINEGNWNAVKIDEVKQHTNADEEFKALYRAITNDHLDKKLNPNLSKFQRVFRSLSVADGVILKGHKIVIPPKLRKRILKAGHEGHQGIEKTKRILRSKVWYPGIDDDIADMVSNCRGAKLQSTTQQENHW